MNKLKNFLTEYILLTLYNTLVLPHLSYGILLWGCQINRLERLQKKIVRIITHSKYNAHTEPIFKKLSILKVSDLKVLHELKFCYQLENNNLPRYFHNSLFKRLSSLHSYNTRHSQNYQIPKIKHSFMKNSLRYRIPFIFNSSPTIITEKIHTHSFSGFKKYVKMYHLKLYNEQCQIDNCYICQ